MFKIAPLNVKNNQRLMYSWNPRIRKKFVFSNQRLKLWWLATDVLFYLFIWWLSSLSGLNKIQKPNHDPGT